MRPMALLAGVLFALLCQACATEGIARTRTARAPDTHGVKRPFEHAPANLVTALQAISTELRGVGLVQYGPSASGFLPAGGRQAFAIELPGDRCMTLVAIATPGVTDMDAALYTPDGEVLAADSQPDSHPAIHVCGTGEPRTVYYVVHSYEGAGSFLMASFSGGRQAVDAVAARLGGRPAIATDIHGPRSVRAAMTDFGEGLHRRGFERRGETTALSLSERQRLRVAVPVRAGRCYAVAAFGEQPLRQVDLRVLDAVGSEVVNDQAPLPAARVQFCARESATYAAETHAVVGTGQAMLVVFDANAHEVLGEAGLWLGHPGKAQGPRPAGADALAKAVEQAHEAGFATLAARFEGQLALGEAQEHRITVARRNCLRLVYAPADGLQGAELQLLRTAAERRVIPLGAESAQSPIELCAQPGEELRIRVIADTGSGGYSLSVFSR